MEEKKSYKSWTISDEFWLKVSWLIPEHERDPNREYKRGLGGGRKPVDKRKVLGGIFYVLRTGCQWKAVPAEYGSGSTIHRYFQEWEQSGFFEAVWAMALEEYDELKGLGWEWLSMDSCMTKAPLAQESVGANPTDRGKKGYKTQPACRRTWPSYRNSRVRSKYP